ncbi:MAG: poly-gamma-glutamate system protein [Spirochaetales bacterium]|nr:poly-gamma-glutamate system protein [Spirochaetales bacterium]
MVAAAFFLSVSERTGRRPEYDRMLEIAGKSSSAFELIRGEKKRLGIDFSHHHSGMLGPDFTGTTTTLGSRESKTTAANPNFSAVIFMLIKELSLNPGDRIALNLSGSFPSINIETIIVLESMGYEPVIISSLGASTHGATDPELTYPDMEHLLYSEGIIQHKSILITPGGDDDIGSNMDQGLLSSAVARLEGKGYDFMMEADFDRNLDSRLNLYSNCKALINVGGNLVSQFDLVFGGHFKNGHLDAGIQKNYRNRGLIGAFLSDGKDVIHIIDIKALALEFGMPIDPSKDETVPGIGEVYFSHRIYPGWVAAVIIAVFIFILFGYYYVEKKSIDQSINQIIESEPLD